MTAVWNKLTTHISTWFHDEKRTLTKNELRLSCSLSTLNQKNLKVIKSSKSFENLNRIQILNFNTSNKGNFNFSQKTNYCTEAISPSTSSRSSGLNTTSGYSTTNDLGNYINPRTTFTIDKKLIGNDFFQNLQIKKLKKTFSVATTINVNKSPDQFVKKNCCNEILTRFKFSSHFNKKCNWTCSKRNKQKKNYNDFQTKKLNVDFLLHKEKENLKKKKNNTLNLYHTLPMSMSWHSNLNCIPHQNLKLVQPINLLSLNEWYPSTNTNNSFLKNQNFTNKILTSSSSNIDLINSTNVIQKCNSNIHLTTPLKKSSWGFFGSSIKNSDTFTNIFSNSKKKPKRSCSVGVDHRIKQKNILNAAIDVNLLNSCHLLEFDQRRQVLEKNKIISFKSDCIKSCKTINSDALKTENVFVPHNSFFDNKNSVICNNQRAIDAKFLALAQNDQPVLNNDIIFKRLEKLGEGSYATVYKSENRLNGSIVALKEIKLQLQEGLPFTAIRESCIIVSILRGLKHANIVCLYQIIHQPQSLILVFEYMKTDLSKLMDCYRKNNKYLDPFQIKLFLYQLLRGLAFCHDKKILHRDLKPQNLLVSDNGELKLADFGLARTKSVPCRTFSHDVVTLWYRPPDVLLGSTYYSTSVDMWGVGCIFAEMCSGFALFPGINDINDQLDKIFSICGVPNPKLWPEVLDLPNYSMFQFLSYQKLEWHQVDVQLGQILALENNAGNMLLNKFLQLNPVNRISAKDAMEHSYFSSIFSFLKNLNSTESVINAFHNYQKLVKLNKVFN